MTFDDVTLPPIDARGSGPLVYDRNRKIIRRAVPSAGAGVVTMPPIDAVSPEVQAARLLAEAIRELAAAVRDAAQMLTTDPAGIVPPDEREGP